METIGKRIKKLRKEMKMTQSEYANIINISQAALSDIEKDKSNPSIDTILAIKEKFNITIDYILTGNKEEKLNLNEYEKELINNYRTLSDRDKIKVETYIEFVMGETEKSYVSKSTRKEEEVKKETG